MGFKARRTYVLAFAEGTPLHGATIKCKGMAGGRVLQWKAEVDATDREEMIGLAVQQLAKVIISWDLEEDDGEPIPITEENISDLEMDQIMCLYEAWLTSVIGVGQSLGKDSGSGRRLPEGSTTPRDSASPDLLNLLTQSSSSGYSNDLMDTPTPA